MGSSSLDILIVGGGICGLSCAIALRRSNHTVRILERSQFKDEVGAAITIPPNASRVLQSWNLDFRKAQMIKFEGVELVSGEGVTLFRSDFSGAEKKFGAPYLLSHRVDLHEALKDMAISPTGPGKPVEIVNGARIMSYDAEAGSVELADGSTLSADLVVAADGVHSAASKFIGTHRPAIPSDNTVMRFLVPTATLLADPATAGLITSDGNCSVCIATSKTKWLIRYPCRDNKLQNFGFYFIDQGQPESQGLTLKTDRASLLRSLEGFPSSIVAAAAKANEVLPLWRCASREPSSQMYRGRLVLVGDAAHAMLPHLGQGAAQSIEDAAALGVLLHGVTAGGSDKTGDSLEARLKLFQEVRKDRVTAIQILSAVPAVEDDFSRVAEKWEKLLPGHEFPKQKLDSYALCAAYDIEKECSALLGRSSS